MKKKAKAKKMVCNLRNVGVTGGGIASDLDAQTGDTEPDAPIEAGEEGEGVGGDEGDEEV